MLEHKTATKQPKRVSPISGVAPPPGFEAHPERRHNGAWKKTETARWKFEQLIKKDEEELQAILADRQSCFDEGVINGLLQIKKLTRILGDMVSKLEKEPDIEKKVKLSSYCMNEIETLTVIQEKQMNQIYGMPKQKVEQTNIELKPILPKPRRGKK